MKKLAFARGQMRPRKKDALHKVNNIRNNCNSKYHIPTEYRI